MDIAHTQDRSKLCSALQIFGPLDCQTSEVGNQEASPPFCSTDIQAGIL